MLRTEIAAGNGAGQEKVLENAEDLGKANSELVQEVKKASKTNGSKGGMNPKTKQNLKKKIRDLAAETSAAVAVMEGENSPINSIVESAGKNEAGGEKTSLAGEIRNLQESPNT